MNLRWLVFSLVFLAYSELGAQTRISIQPAPQPGQKLHVTMTQEFALSVDPGSVQPGMQMSDKGVIDFLQTNGRFDELKRIEAQITIERAEIGETINGTYNAATGVEKLAGQAVAAVFDSAGKVLSIKAPKDFQRFSGKLKALVGGAYGGFLNFPATTLAIGERTTVPWEIPVRLPGSATEAPYKVQTIITLRSIEKQGEHRVARFDQRIESIDAGQFTVAGAGTVDLNLERGFVTAMTTEWTATGPFRPKGAAADAPPSTVRATMKVTTSATE